MAAELQRFRKEYVQPVQLRYQLRSSPSPQSSPVCASSWTGSVSVFCRFFGVFM